MGGTLRRATIRVILCSLVVACTPASLAPPSSSGAPPGTAAPHPPGPCEDFDAYVNAAWQASNPIPEGRTKWSRRLAAREANRAALRDVLATMAARTDWAPGSREQVLGDLYASCMDEVTLDARGLAPLSPWLAEIDAMRTAADVQRLLRHLHAIGVPALFGTQGAFDYREPARFEANIVAGAQDAAALDVARGLTRSGLPAAQAAEGARIVAEVDRSLARASLPPEQAADPAQTWHRMSFADLERLAPHVDWQAYFDDAGWSRDDVNVPDPGRLRQVDHELAALGVPEWKLYLRWRLLASAAPALPARLALDDAPSSPPRERWRTCVDTLEEAYGDLVGRAYVEQAFPPAAKARVRAVVLALVASLHEEIDGLDWMAAETRRAAHEAIRVLDVQIGYPEVWRGGASTAVDRRAFWENLVAGRRQTVRVARALVGKPTDRGSWALPASSPDAYIEPQLHEFVLPAGFLQPPAFSLDADDASVFGAIGAGVAHDLLHGIDLLGADFQADGAPRSWWTDADRSAFEARGQCIRDQFEAFVVAPGVRHVGKRVLGEAAADLGGARVALRALRRSMAAHPLPVVDGRTPEQRFFIALATLRGDQVRPEAIPSLLASDIHPLGRFRILGTLSNLPDFGGAFSCPAGAPMLRPPDQRCEVW